MKRTAIALLCIAAATVGAIAALTVPGRSGATVIINRSVPSASPSPVSTPSPVDVPVHLTIPSLGIDSPTKTVGLYRDGSIDTPCDPLAPYGFRPHGYSLAWWHAQCNPNQSAWFNGSPRPGVAGDAIIDGHVDWYHDPYDCQKPDGPCKWSPDIPAVFINLDKVGLGATVVVTDASGQTRTFVVDRITTMDYPQTPADFYSTSGQPTLTLVTCAGVFQSLQTGMTKRLYVHTTLLGGTRS
jgi:hypothetical protein